MFQGPKAWRKLRNGGLSSFLDARKRTTSRCREKEGVSMRGNGGNRSILERKPQKYAIFVCVANKGVNALAFCKCGIQRSYFRYAQKPHEASSSSIQARACSRTAGYK